MKQYIGTFTDIDKHPYDVTVTTTGSGEVTLTFVNETPFETEMDTSGDILYEPIKRQSGTLHILTDNLSDYKFDLYSPTAKNTKVIISNEDHKCVFAGYVTPSMYDIGFTHEREELDIDVIDGLSALEHYKYTTIGEKRENRSMLEIIMKCLNECEVYNGLYLAKNLHLASGDTSEPLSRLYINEQIFFPDDDQFDSDGNRITDDDDTMLKVLEKIMTYLGLTMVAEGDEVYILDYDGIRHREHNSLPYWHWDELDASATPTTVDLAVEYGDNYYYEISGSSYAQSDQSLSMDKVYNKVTVVDNFDIIDSVIDRVLDDDKFTRFYPAYPWTEVQLQQYNPYIGSIDDMKEFEKKWAYYQIGTSDDVTLHQYTIDYNATAHTGSNVTEFDGMAYLQNWTIPDTSRAYLATNTPDTLTAWRQYPGAYVVKWYSADDDLGHNVRFFTEPYFKYTNYLVLQNNGITSAFQGYMGENPASHSTFFKFPLVEIKPPRQLPMPLNSSSQFFVLTLDAQYVGVTGKYSDALPVHFGYRDGKAPKYTEDSGWNWLNAFLSCQIELDGQYWAGNAIVSDGQGWVFWNDTESQDQWTTEPTWFPLYLDTDDNSENWMNKKFSLRNNIPFTWGIDKKGYAIPLPPHASSNDLTIRLSCPNHPTMAGTSSAELTSVWISDFKVELVSITPDGQNEANMSTDSTVYTNIIDTEHVEQLDDIDMDICTYDGKHISYNTVSVVSGNDYTYLDTVYHDALVDDLDSDYHGKARLEEYLCVKVAKQYSQPRRRLKVTLNTPLPVTELVYEHNLGAWFVIDSIDKDFAMKAYTYTLIEKV
jgi:hypothetical protein